MLRTTYLNLKKPEGSDPVNVQDFNDNADTIDTEVNARVKSSGGDIANTKVSAYTASTASFPVPAAGETPKVFMGKIKKFFEDIRNATTGACFIGQIVNNCVTNNAKLPLSAAQGKELMDLYTVLNSNFTQLNSNLATAQTDISTVQTDSIKYYMVTTQSLKLDKDTYNVIYDTTMSSILAGKTIIGIAVREIQANEASNFYANIYIKGTELRAVVSVAQYYLFKVAILYK